MAGCSWRLYTLPFRRGGKVNLERVGTRTYVRQGVALPSLKAAPKTAFKAPPVDASCVLRFIAAKDFVDQKAWTRACTAPRAFIQDWVGASVDVTLMQGCCQRCLGV